MSKRGAPAAYRGYRLQALYILKRILTLGEEETIFQPEGKEDLDILDSDGNLIEAVQVKSYPSLVFSDLSDSKSSDGPRSKNSVEPFIHRAAKLIKNRNCGQVNLVNFGVIGPELEQAWADELRPNMAWEKVRKKLEKSGLPPDDITRLFSNVSLIPLDETTVKTEVFALLCDMLTGIDPESAFDLLNFRIYLASERQQPLTKFEIIEMVQNVGKFLVECRARHAEWFTAILPIKNPEIGKIEWKRLREEFYEGVSARYEHIVAGLDFKRHDKLADIGRTFEKNNIAIIHAASGQGKSALAWRYLHDHFPDNWRFSIELVEGPRHALQIAAALNGHATALKAPMIVYIDVRPNDTAWPDLVLRLSRNPYLKILVTIREEDFKRADLPVYELDFGDIDLEFNKEEARSIFERAGEQNAVSGFLDFHAAWHAFGGKGPLLEFVFLLTQTTSLGERLKSQIQRIRREVRENSLSSDELKLLRLVAVATAFEARVRTRNLIDCLDLPEPRLILELFEREYLIRQNADKHCIEAMHPIRSQILAELLTDLDIDTWIDSARAVLPVIMEEDLEPFLLHIFADRAEDYTKMLEIVFEFQPGTWTGIGGVLRSLLWAGVRDYVESNRAVIQSVYDEVGDAWWGVFDFDLTGQLNSEPLVKSDFIWKTITPENKIKINGILKKQTPKSDAFNLASNWMQSCTKRPAEPALHTDWSNLAEILYWISHFNTAHHIETWLTDSQLDFAASDLNLPVLADLSIGMYLCNEKRHARWMTGKRELLKERMAKQYKIIAFENVEDEKNLKIHFLPIVVSENQGGSESRDYLHHATMERIDILNRLFPEFEKYASQGYGFKLGNMAPLPFDPTFKNIARNNLKLNWATLLNGLAINLGKLKYRPATWNEYVGQIIDIRSTLIPSLRELGKAIEKYFAKSKPYYLFKDHIDSKTWDSYSDSLSNLPVFPKTAVDRWGFVSEGSAETLRDAEDGSQMNWKPSVLAFRKYKQYKQLQRDYFDSLQNFYKQAIHVISINFKAGKIHPKKRKTVIKGLEKLGFKPDFDHLSTRNLWSAVKSVESYQKEFRKLFGHIVDSEILTELELAERETVKQTWLRWYFYANKPHLKITKPAENINLRVANEKRNMDQKIKKALIHTNSENVTVTKLKTDLRWENVQTIWIALYIQNPIQLYESFQQLVSNLQKAFGKEDYKNLASYMIEKNYGYVVIIPLFRGKMINDNVWPLPTLITLYGSATVDEKPFSFMMKPTSSEILAELGFEMWDVDTIKTANKLWESFLKVWIHISQSFELIGVPISESVKEYEEIKADHFREQSKKISDCFVDLMNAKNVLIDKYNELADTEQQISTTFKEAIQILRDIHDEIFFFDGDTKSFNTEELRKYCEVLEKNVFQIEAIRLLWITDVLDQR